MTPVEAQDSAGQPLSPWDVLGLPGPVPAANFLTTKFAHQYRLIVDALAGEQSVSLTGVGYDDLVALVRSRLPEHTSAALLEDMNLEERLGQLVNWGTCEVWQDRAETEADFLRNRSRYQLTETGVGPAPGGGRARDGSAQARRRRW